MGAWDSRGLRGSILEESINYTNEYYKKHKLALLQKVPTPITPVKINDKGQITLGYFEQKSTVDFIGMVQGIGVCFDAKECQKDTFPLQNIHEHQMEFMKNFEEQGGIAFFLIYFSTRNSFYYLRYKEALKFYTRGKKGGRKSFRFDELSPDFMIRGDQGRLIPWLIYLQLDLSERS